MGEWKPIAETFKRLCKERSLAIDNTVTADAARVLRVPGTKNFKKKYGEPRPVEVVSEGTAPLNAQEFFAKLRDLLGDKAPTPFSTGLDLPGQRPINATKSPAPLNHGVSARSTLAISPTIPTVPRE